jgi:hypothetical protein
MVLEASIETKASPGLGVLRSGKTAPFRPRGKLRTVKARPAIAFGGGQAYGVGQAGVLYGDSGLRHMRLI